MQQPTYTTFFTNLAAAYDSIGIPEDVAGDATIQAENWKQALLIRLNEVPEYQFKAKVRSVREESTEGDMYVQYTVTSEFGNLYVDKYESNSEDYGILKMFNNVEELKEWLAS